jgi:hypothetical protein
MYFLSQKMSVLRLPHPASLPPPPTDRFPRNKRPLSHLDLSGQQPKPRRGAFPSTFSRSRPGKIFRTFFTTQEGRSRRGRGKPVEKRQAKRYYIFSVKLFFLFPVENIILWANVPISQNFKFRKEQFVKRP